MGNLENINYENWTYTYPNPHAITCFGGLNGFVNWSQFFSNLTIAPIHILHFNRNDNVRALNLYCKEYDYNIYTYISYSEKFIIYLYDYYGFKIEQIIQTTISYIVVGSRSV